MLSQIVLNYQMLINSLEKLIELSGFGDDYLSRKIGVKPANFLVKKQMGNWTTTEVLKLLSIIENKKIAHYYTDYIDAIKIRESEKGIFISSSEFEKRMKWE